MSPYINYIIITALSIFCLTLLILLISVFRKIRSASSDKINLIGPEKYKEANINNSVINLDFIFLPVSRGTE